MNIFQLLAAVSGLSKRVQLQSLFLTYVITHVSRQTRHFSREIQLFRCDTFINMNMTVSFLINSQTLNSDITKKRLCLFLPFNTFVLSLFLQTVCLHRLHFCHLRNVRAGSTYLKNFYNLNPLFSNIKTMTFISKRKNKESNCRNGTFLKQNYNEQQQFGSCLNCIYIVRKK